VKHFVAQPNDGPDEEHRKWVFVTIPVYTLKEMCFQTMRRMRVNAHVVKSLGLPRSLTEDYYMYMVRFFRKQLFK
jgi:hypothetical protein